MSKKYSELIKAAMENITGVLPATIKKGLMYFDDNVGRQRPMIDDGTDVSQLMLEKHLPEARRTTKVQLTEDVNVEVEGTLTHTKGGTGVNSLVGFSRKALVVKDDETGYEFGDAGGGAVFEANQVAHGLAALDVIYHDGSGWVKAQANAANTVAEYVVVEVFDVDNFKAAKFGKFEITAHGLTVGEHYFLSQLTAGALDVSEPITGYSCPILYAEDANNVHVEIYRANLIGDGIASDSEIGSIMAFGNVATPTGFLYCNGDEVSRITYGDLFAAIGTNFGAGNGVDTFNLPDLRGQFLRGIDDGAGVDTDGALRTIGSSQSDETRSHDHYQFYGEDSAGYFGGDLNTSPKSNMNSDPRDYAISRSNTLNNRANTLPGSFSGGSETRPVNVGVKYYIRYAAKGAVEAESKVNPTVIIPDATTDIDWQTGEVFTESRDADKTFTFSNTQDGKTIIVSIENTDVADHTINFPGTVSWPNGTAITNVVAGTTTVFTFVDFAGTIRATAVESF